MVSDQLFHILRTLNRQVIAQARANQDLFDALQTPRFAVHLNKRAVVRGEVAANARKYATGFAASSFNFGRLAAQTVHIGCGAAQI